MGKLAAPHPGPHQMVHHGQAEPAGLQLLRKIGAPADFLRNTADFPAGPFIPHHRHGILQRFRQRPSALQQRGQGKAEPDQQNPPQKDRTEKQSVPFPFPRALPGIQVKTGKEEQDKQRKPGAPLRQDPPGGNQLLRHGRQRKPQRLKKREKRRENHRDHQEKDNARKENHENRISQRLPELGNKILLSFVIPSGPLQ
mgnify:CR=1 FL=1